MAFQYENAAYHFRLALSIFICLHSIARLNAAMPSTECTVILLTGLHLRGCWKLCPHFVICHLTCTCPRTTGSLTRKQTMLTNLFYTGTMRHINPHNFFASLLYQDFAPLHRKINSEAFSIVGFLLDNLHTPKISFVAGKSLQELMH